MIWPAYNAGMRLLFAIGMTACTLLAGEAVVLSHELKLSIDPATSSFTSQDRLRVRGPGRIEIPAMDGVTVEPAAIEVGAGEQEVVVRFAGRIKDPVKKSTAATWVAGDRTAGTIGPEGSYLVRGFYVPTEEPTRFRVEISVSLPHRAVSQGRRLAEREVDGRHVVTYASDHRSDSLVVVTGPWTVTEALIDGVSCRTYLYEQDQQHAAILLDTLRAEVPRFQKMLGKVPDGRFDVVENFFETGYGFANFTLLGETVIRYVCAKSRGVLPAGYLDHELVHGWLGNHLLVDYEKGNWCEALTTYFTNYGATVREKKDAAHREKVSRSYSLRVGPKNDYPIRSFRQKRHAHENDIGYGKGSMVFHMLAREWGRERFNAAVRNAIAEHGGEKLGWDALIDALGGGKELHAWFEPWLDRTGAPVLELGTVKFEPGRVIGTLRQTQEGKAYPLDKIPVHVVTENGAAVKEISSRAKETLFTIETNGPALRIEVDPNHHIFRRVPRSRISPCLAGVRTAPKRVGFGDPALLKRLGIQTVDPSLPTDAAVLAIGIPDELREKMAAAARRQDPSFKFIENGFEYAGQTFDDPGDSILFVYARPEAPGLPVAFFHGNSEAAYSRTRFLPYYGNDTVVVFRGGRPARRGNVSIDRSLVAETSPARRGKADAILDALALLTDERWKGRQADRSQRLANELRGRVVTAGLAFVTTPTVLLMHGSLSDKRRLLIEAERGVFDSSDEFLPFHISGQAKGGVRFRRIATHPADDVKGSLVLLPEDATADLAREYEKKGAAIVAFKASEPTMKARGAETAWANAMSDAMKARWPVATTNRDVATAGLFSAADEPLKIPCIYVAPSLVETLEENADASGTLEAGINHGIASTSNIVGVLGSPRERGILLCAHWDGVGEIAGRTTQGAADNAAGVAIVLWVAERLKADYDAGRLKKPVVVALFGGEEMGLAGSRQFAELLASPKSPLARPLAAVNVDAIGSLDGSKVYLIGRSRYPDLLNAFQTSIEGSRLALQRDIDKFAFEKGSDHWPLHKAGIPAVTVWSADYREMNTPQDTLDKVDIATVREIAHSVYRMVRDLAK